MKKYFYGLGAIVILVAAYVVVKPKVISVETTVLALENFDEVLAADGKIRSQDRRTVYAYATGELMGLQAKVGDNLRKGQILTKLEWDRTIYVKSPIDGVLTKVYRDSAGPIVRGEPIFEVSSLDNLEVVSEVLTPEAVRLNINGEAKILNWGGEGELKAKISKISKAGTVKVSALGVEEERTEVKLLFEEVPAKLREKFGDNYHVDIIFMISREPNTLCVPLGALYKSGDHWAVYTVQAGRARSRKIQISKRNDRKAIVTDGIKEGERVILFPGDKIREGVRVKYAN